MRQQKDGAMLYIVIETFRRGAVPEVYRRLDQSGRMLPEGVEYVESWIDQDFQRCFQVMRADREEQLREWAKGWQDLVEFEIVPVMSSTEARERLRAGKT